MQTLRIPLEDSLDSLVVCVDEECDFIHYHTEETTPSCGCNMSHHSISEAVDFTFPQKSIILRTAITAELTMQVFQWMLKEKIGF